MERDSPLSGFAFPSPPRRDPGLGFRPTSAQRSNSNSFPGFGSRASGCALGLWEPALRPRPRIGGKIVMNKWGNESHGGLAGARAGRCLLEAAECAARWPRRPHPPLEPTARPPRGPDLISSLGGSATAFLHFLPPLQPPKKQAWSQARLRKALGTGGARKPGSNPEAGGKSSLQSPAPLGPLAGNLPSGRPALAPGSVQGRPRSPLPSPGASTQRDSQWTERVPSGVQNPRAHPPRGCVEVAHR